MGGEGRGVCFIFAKGTIPKFQKTFPGIDLVSITYVRCCSIRTVSLLHSRNTIRRLMKNRWLGLIEIMYLLPVADFKNVPKMLSFAFSKGLVLFIL